MKYYKLSKIIIIIIIIWKIIKYTINKTSKIINKIFYEKTLIGYVHNKIIRYVYKIFIKNLPSMLYYSTLFNLSLLSLYNMFVPHILYKVSKSTFCVGIKTFIVSVLCIVCKFFFNKYIK